MTSTQVGATARRTRTVTRHDIELFTELSGDRNPIHYDDVITARATVLSMRADKPITTLATSVTNQDGLAVLDGTAVVWRDPTVTAHTQHTAGDGASQEESA